MALHVIQQSCFTSGTLIVGRQGSKRIEAFRGYKDVGDACDWVVSRSEHNDDGPLVLRRVLQTFERLAFVLELRVDGRLIGTTAEHPFFVRGKGWTTAQEIRAGDEVRLMGPGWATVEDVRDTGRYEAVYNLEVEEDHTYFVGGDEWGLAVWAHNLGCGEIEAVAVPRSDGYTHRLGWGLKNQEPYARKDPTGPGWWGQKPNNGSATRPYKGTGESPAQYEARVAGSESYYVKHPTDERFIEFDTKTGNTYIDTKHSNRTADSIWRPYDQRRYPKAQEAKIRQLAEKGLQAKRQAEFARANPGTKIEWWSNDEEAVSQLNRWLKELSLDDVITAKYVN